MEVIQMPTDYHRALRRAREDAGYTLDDVLVEMRVRLPKPMLASKGTLQRIETEIPEEKVDIHLINFFCRLYNVSVDEVSPYVARALDEYRRALDYLEANPLDRPYRSKAVSSRCTSPIEQRPLPGFEAGAVWCAAGPLLFPFQPPAGVPRPSRVGRALELEVQVA